MSTTPTNLHIAVIGAGVIAQPIARLLTAAGHTVKIANSRSADTLSDVAQRTGATAATTEDAVHNAHVVVVAVPTHAIPKLDKRLFMSLQHTTIVIDVTDYEPSSDGRIDELEAGEADSDSSSSGGSSSGGVGMAESRWVETQLGREVVKVFNTVDAYTLDKRGQPTGTADRIALPVSGADAVHKATVIALLDQMGFDGVDAGSIDDSWRQQPGTPVYCTNLDREGVRRALSTADRSKSAAVRSVLMERWAPQLKAGPESWENLYVVAREVMDEQYGK